MRHCLKYPTFTTSGHGQRERVRERVSEGERERCEYARTRARIPSLVCFFRLFFVLLLLFFGEGRGVVCIGFCK